MLTTQYVIGRKRLGTIDTIAANNPIMKSSANPPDINSGPKTIALEKKYFIAKRQITTINR